LLDIALEFTAVGYKNHQVSAMKILKLVRGIDAGET
jgi:hypothetical protein